MLAATTRTRVTKNTRGLFHKYNSINDSIAQVVQLAISLRSKTLYPTVRSRCGAIIIVSLAIHSLVINVSCVQIVAKQCVRRRKGNRLSIFTTLLDR